MEFLVKSVDAVGDRVVLDMMMRRRLVSNLNAKNSMLTEARLWDWAFFFIVGPELKTLVHHQ